MEENKALARAEGRIHKRVSKLHDAIFSERPPFPRSINIELNNTCNHTCTFCAYRLMEREKGQIDKSKLEKWLKDAHLLGSREIGLHSGAEPLASPDLEHFIRYCKDIGYEYVYISTNGSMATPKRLASIVESGIDSIKFSINAGNRETYKKIHGRDHFERVIAAVKHTSSLRGRGKLPYLAVSFVVVDENRDSMNELKTLLGDFVDEFFFIEAENQSGQLPKGGLKRKSEVPKCGIPFNKVHITWEGFLRVCCNDYENMLALEDLNKISLEEAFYGDRYREIRRRHLDNKLEGTLCYNCLYDCSTPIRPLNSELYDATHDSPPMNSKLTEESQSPVHET